MNVRTYHKLCLSGLLGFILIFVGMFVGNSAVFGVVSALGVFWVIVMGLVGAVTAILMIRGKLKLGCPVCERMARIKQEGREGLIVECERCGDLFWEMSSLRMKILTEGEREERSRRRAKLRRKTGIKKGSPLKAPIWYPKSFALIFTPVVLSILIASIIHEFNFFYIVIPGFWCYGVGSFTLHSIMTGEVEVNGGTCFRSESPIRYWLHLGLWIPFYIGAAYFPIGLALQESGKSLDDLFPERIERFEEIPEFDVK